jgi:hypothetical protein
MEVDMPGDYTGVGYGTFCLLGNHSRLHRDSDFEPFDEGLGLTVMHP